MALMAFIPEPCPSQGKMMCWHRWILPFLVELWVCLGNTAICWITRPSTPGSARTALVPGSTLKNIQDCHAGLKSHGKPGGWAGNRAAMSRRAACWARYQFWAQQQHWQDGPRHCLQQSPRTHQEPRKHHLRLLPRESLLPSRNPKIQLKLTTCGYTLFTVWAENASFPLPSASLSCWHSAAETWSNQCSYGEVCLAGKMILLNRSIKFVSVFADNFHKYITLKYGTSILTYFLWCSKWLGKNPL